MKKSVETIFNVVIGTAGHIDHGKSTLVQRLTGIDPDRLPEEKERGLTIDLGFAPLTLKSGLRVGIIDVPGHERLVKNMVAGATGIDLVLLVVAADDGVMPQTEEHVAIMDLLGLQHGLIVVTKIDMVDAEMRELVREDVRERLAGTFLEDAPLIEVSGTTGEGIDTLLTALHDALKGLRPRQAEGVFRMPIQRVFSAKGHGTVLTGVPVQGTAKIGDTLEVSPLRKKGRVRGIHAYKEATDLARAGHSSAINITDVDYREVHRGMVLTAPGYFQASEMLEARFLYLASNSKPLVHQTRIRLHVGTAEAIGRIYLLEEKVLQPGEETFVQFRLEQPLVAAPGDRYVVRAYSPAVTLGGGEVLGESRWRLKTGKSYVLKNLKERSNAVRDRKEFIVSLIGNQGFAAVRERDLAVAASLPAAELRDVLAALIDESRICRAGRHGSYLCVARLEEARERALECARAYFARNPRRFSLDKQQLRQKLNADELFFQKLLENLQEREIVKELSGGRLRFRDHGGQLSAQDQQIRAALLAAWEAGRFSPPAPSDVAQSNGWDPDRAAEIASFIEDEGLGIHVGEGIYMHADAVAAAAEQLREYLNQNESITAAGAKTLLGSTRKYVIPLLEHLDKTGLTMRQGDVRVLRKR